MPAQPTPHGYRSFPPEYFSVLDRVAISDESEGLEVEWFAYSDDLERATGGSAHVGEARSDELLQPRARDQRSCGTPQSPELGEPPCLPCLTDELPQIQRISRARLPRLLEEEAVNPSPEYCPE